MDYQANDLSAQELSEEQGQMRRGAVEELPDEHDRTRRQPRGWVVEGGLDDGMAKREPDARLEQHAVDEKPGRTSGMLRVVLCWVALVATIACNGLFEAFKLGGVTSAEVSNQVFAWFTPAGYVFSIWGVIYAALIAWMIAETMRARKGKALSGRQMALFLGSCVLNVGWLVVFHFQLIDLALVVLIFLWAVLAMLYVSLRDDETRSRLNLAPFSVYFAWSTVAMIANATHLATRLVASSTLANQVSTILLTVAVLVVAYLAIRRDRDYVFPLVVIWATVGVGIHVATVDVAVSTAVLVLSAIAMIVFYLPLVLTGRKPLAKATYEE